MPCEQSRSSCGPETGRACHYCALPITDGESAIRGTQSAWAHVTCWYDGGPFEAERALKAIAGIGGNS